MSLLYHRDRWHDAEQLSGGSNQTAILHRQLRRSPHRRARRCYVLFHQTPLQETWLGRTCPWSLHPSRGTISTPSNRPIHHFHQFKLPCRTNYPTAPPTCRHSTAYTHKYPKPTRIKPNPTARTCTHT